MSEKTKQHLMLKMQQLSRDEKINILITGATGSGKSSTINALFGKNIATVGQGVTPETMDIKKFELSNIILWDSPGLGDSEEADRRHSNNIIDKLHETDKNNNALIDLVLVILDGSSRDLGTSFELINKVIIPNIGKDNSRLLIAINQCDMAMKGRYWNYEKNKPEKKLIDFLDKKVESTRKRIFDATNVTVEPIYYSAGYKDGNEEQQPYNLSKLFLLIISNTKPKKRAVYVNDMNTNKEVWEHDDQLIDYAIKIQNTLIDSIIESAQTGGEIGEELGSLFGSAGRAGGKAVGTAIGAIYGVFKGIFNR